MVTTYDNQFYHDNVYGHALALLQTVCEPDSSVHLDVGCGFGRIAEPLTESLGRIYVGVDADADGLESLSGRGFETHRFFLSDHDANLAFFRSILSNRRLGSITILDTLEHLFDPQGVVSALRALAVEFAAPIVVSVPNIAHVDVGIKLLMGRFDYTEDGLLDHTHVSFFTEDRLLRMMSSAGWHAIAAKNDVHYIESDQHFPPTHIALAEGSSLNQLLRGIRSRADDNGSVNQLVRLFMGGPPSGSPSYVSPITDQTAPFITIVVRTDGSRPERLRELLLTISGQTSTKFEVIIVGRRLSRDKRLKVVERIIEDNVAWLRAKIRLVRIEEENGAAGANAGAREAKGEYIAVLDDDCVLFAHWVESFQKLAQLTPGSVLRTVSVIQRFNEHQGTKGHLSSFAASAIDFTIPKAFDLPDQLEADLSPASCLAFPRSAFTDLRIRFDEALVQGEVWDFLLNVSFLAGVSSESEITSLQRRWNVQESVEKKKTPKRSSEDRARIYYNQDTQQIVLPAGSASIYRASSLEERLNPKLNKIAEQFLEKERKTTDELAKHLAYIEVRDAEFSELRKYVHSCESALLEAQARIAILEPEMAQLRDYTNSREVALREAHERIVALEDELTELREFTSTRETALKDAWERIALLDATMAEMGEQIKSLQAENKALNNHIQTIFSSRSWRLTSPIRRLTGHDRDNGK